MTLSIDTNVFIDLICGRNPRVRERFRHALTSDEPLVASLIVLQELRYGAHIHPRPDAQLKSVDRVLRTVRIELFDERDIAASARIRAQLRQRGLAIGAYDALIAGQALARGWTVITANTREFARIDGLNVIDWSLAAD